MKIKLINPPREFAVGNRDPITLKHSADITLEPNELVTFVSDSGSEHDVSRKSWGYYATQSLNSRLVQLGLRAVLAVNKDDRFYLMLVEKGKEKDFQSYLESEGMEVVTWLDTDESVQRMKNRLK